MMPFQEGGRSDLELRIANHVLQKAASSDCQVNGQFIAAGTIAQIYKILIIKISIIALQILSKEVLNQI
jgi:hypothetical protein